MVELPNGWQPGIPEGAAEWDEDWGKFEDEGCANDMISLLMRVGMLQNPNLHSFRKNKISMIIIQFMAHLWMWMKRKETLQLMVTMHLRMNLHMYTVKMT
ncbi:hypothetical protein QN277_018377 [Acacia crassicarpa]|uniref:Uncharacterized protein n=1 Tax=Acacia crassicarpa TaxID=499986 RepID=A0AAE1JQE8_9FABA|nr:hypothetical protein QN277_018377 [Acacia crassicarpa]